MKNSLGTLFTFFIVLFSGVTGCSMLEKSQDGSLVLKNAEVNIKDIKVVGITFGDFLIFSDGSRFDVNNLSLGIVKYLSDIKEKKFDFTIKNLVVDAVMEITNPAPLNFELNKVSTDFYLDQEKIFNVTDKLGIDIPKESTKDNPIRGTLPLNSNFQKIISAENIVMKGVATLKIKIAGTGFDYDYGFEESYRIPKEEIQKKIDDTIAQYVKMAVDYIKKQMPGGGDDDSELPSVDDLFKLLQ